jgi:hypothetical protein
LYAKNYKISTKEIKEDIKIERHLCLWIGNNHIVKMSKLPIAMYRVNKICTKIPVVGMYNTKIEKSKIF